MHQTVTRKDATAYIAGRKAGSMGPHDLKVAYVGAEPHDWVEDIEQALEETLTEWKTNDPDSVTSDQSRDALEGNLSATLHAGLAALPSSVLTDRGFWRFCAAYLHDLIVWRHQSTNAEAALYPYFGVASDSLGYECVPHRMFNRAHIALSGGGIANSDDPYALAKFGARDVWASHILRVRTSYAPIVAHELLADVRAGKLPTDPVRLLAKNLKRVRSNVLFEVLDGPQARDLIDREEARVAATLAASLDSATAAD